MAITPYFDNFPKVDYNLTNDPNVTESLTNIFTRYGILRSVLSNSVSYVLYEIEEGDTPEIIAEKVYDDPGAGWIILYANQIIDPQFEWPLTDENFKKYIINKYGSVANAASTIHHYEKVVDTVIGDDTYTRTYLIGKERYTENHLDVPYTYYTPYSNNYSLTADTLLVTTDNTYFRVDHSNHYSYDDTSIPEYYSYETVNYDGKTVYLNTHGNAITNYDYELRANDDRKIIKVVKKQYYNQIISEFKAMNMGTPSYVRIL